MILKDIDILNFKNIASAQLSFSPGVNCLLGMNGMGKSNLLEAIHFLAMAKPMTGGDAGLLKHGEESMMVKGRFESDAGVEDCISAGIIKGSPKKVKLNGKDYKRLSEHIGRFPVVSITPADSKLVAGAAEERRKFVDIVISQADPVYLNSLIRYGKALDSRNKMLRASIRDVLLYESVESAMIEAASVIYDIRKKWIEDIAPVVSETYSSVSGRPEKIILDYKSQLNGTSLAELLKERRAKDEILGFSSAGPHRDDLEISLDGYPLRTTGSQGQIKSFTVALRLAVFEFLKQVKHTTPLLLLDDIFDKLDAERVSNIMKEVSKKDRFGQIFITDTNRKHLDDIVRVLPGDSALFNVSEGNFSKLTAS